MESTLPITKKRIEFKVLDKKFIKNVSIVYFDIK